MGVQAKRFLEKHNINSTNLLYITKNGRKSVMHLEDGSIVETFLPIKTIMEELPEDTFGCINMVNYLC